MITRWKKKQINWNKKKSQEKNKKKKKKNPKIIYKGGVDKELWYFPKGVEKR